MKDKKSVSYHIGQLLGSAFVACVAACLIAIFIASTVKFIAWIF